MRYAAERRNLAESIAELREIADGRDHVLAEATGITAGAWYAWPSTHVGHELVAAGMLIMAGPDGHMSPTGWAGSSYVADLAHSRVSRRLSRSRHNRDRPKPSAAGSELVSEHDSYCG